MILSHQHQQIGEEGDLHGSDTALTMKMCNRWRVFLCIWQCNRRERNFSLRREPDLGTEIRWHACNIKKTCILENCISVCEAEQIRSVVCCSRTFSCSVTPEATKLSTTLQRWAQQNTTNLGGLHKSASNSWPLRHNHRGLCGIRKLTYPTPIYHSTLWLFPGSETAKLRLPPTLIQFRPTSNWSRRRKPNTLEENIIPAFWVVFAALMSLVLNDFDGTICLGTHLNCWSSANICFVL